MIGGKVSDCCLQRFITARSSPQRRFGSRSNHLYSGSRTVGFDAHRPGELENPFSHASDPYPRTSRLNFWQSFGGHAPAFIANLQDERFVILDDADTSGLTSRMAMNVREAFLDNAEQ